jgi:protein phosphatase
MRSGHLTAAEARLHPQRNVITRALGSEVEVAVDTHLIPVMPKDRFLICSDGLTTMVEDAYIQQILATHRTACEATQALINAANEAGGRDNISCIVIDITRKESVRRNVAPRSKLWRWIGMWMLLAALILGGIGYGVARYAQTQAYLAPSPRGTVNIYEGIPGHMLGMSLNSLSEETTVVISALSAGDQEKINNHISYNSIDHARGALDEMARYTKPKTSAKDFEASDPKVEAP